MMIPDPEAPARAVRPRLYGERSELISLQGYLFLRACALQLTDECIARY